MYIFVGNSLDEQPLYKVIERLLFQISKIY